MSIAPLLTKCLTCWKDWPGQPARLGQIVKTAPSGLTVSVPQAGHFFGGFGLRALLFLRGSFGETTWGITSPARITTTSSPSRTSLRARSSSLWRVAVLTVTPPTWTGSSIANGTRWPVRPTFQTTLVHRRRRRRRRELPGDRPARLAPDHAQLPPQRPLVDLDDDAVDLVVERLAPLLPPVAALDDALDALVVVGVGVDLEAALAQPLDLVHVGGEVEAADGADPVDPGRERPFGGQRRVELADRAGGRVARVGEGRFLGFGAALVERFEGGDRQVDLAAHFDQLRRVRDPQRDRADRAQVLGHVLADPAVAAGRAADQDPVLVGERDRQAVDLRLGRVAELRGGDVEALQVVGQPRSPRRAAPPRCGRCRARASARGARPARSAPAAAPRPAGSASPACAAPGARPRSRAARRAARRRRRRRPPVRRGRSRARLWRSSSCRSSAARCSSASLTPPARSPPASPRSPSRAGARGRRGR